MRADLESYLQSIDPLRSPRLKAAVGDTVALLGGSVDTIDALVQKLNSGQLDQEIGAQNLDLFSRNRVRRERVTKATIAISAAFFSKERRAQELGFGRYRNFLYQIFPGADSNWLSIPKTGVSHVLTFNYDQIFEKAFLDRFHDLHGFSLYGQRVLNSGLNLNGISFETEAFSFLKLHGSVGMWVTDFPGDPIYSQDEPHNRDDTAVDDGLFFSNRSSQSGRSCSQREPLLFFPSERQFITSKESGFLFHRYGREVWNRAREIISTAREIHVIGYSFGGIDRGPVLDLLSEAQNCERLVIQSPDADDISSRIKFERVNLRNLIEPAPFCF